MAVVRPVPKAVILLSHIIPRYARLCTGWCLYCLSKVPFVGINEAEWLRLTGTFRLAEVSLLLRHCLLQQAVSAWLPDCGRVRVRCPRLVCPPDVPIIATKLGRRPRASASSGTDRLRLPGESERCMQSIFLFDVQSRHGGLPRRLLYLFSRILDTAEVSGGGAFSVFLSLAN